MIFCRTKAFSIAVFLVWIFLLQNQVMAQAEFIENQGQWKEDLHFLAKLTHGDFWLSSGKATFVLSDFGQEVSNGKGHPHGNPDKARLHTYAMEFSGAAPSARSKGREKLRRYHNYYTSSSSRRWRSGVPLYSAVVQENLYPGIDLQWKEEKGNLKYEFVLQPGASPDNIRIRYRGLEDIRLDKGELVLKTSLGTIREQKLLAWQTDRLGRKIPVSCRFRLSGDSTTGFEFPSGYDVSKPLVIDPILVFSSFSGSRSDNWGFTSTYGEESSPYAAGIALGPRFPVTPGAFSGTFAGDSIGINAYSTYDIGILKFNPAGTELLFATYIGGAEAEAPASIVVDKDSNLIVLGSSSSAGYPVTANAFDTSYNGGTLVSPYGPGESVVQFRRGSDIVVSRFSKDGRQLLGSTFLGGSANDGLLTLLELGNSPLVKNYGDSFRGEVISDSLGRIYIASHTLSLDFPLASAIQSQLAGGSDAIFAVLSPGLDSLKFSTYHGGSLDDAAYSLQFGKGGDVYLSGGTASADFPASPGTIKPFFGGFVDGFISRFQPGSSSPVRTTFLGTNRYDQSYFVQVDRAGNVYSYGQTIGNYPVTSGVYTNPGSAQYIHCLSPNLDSTRFSTVFGSGTLTPNISPTAFLVDDCGRIYCSGWGGSTNTLTGYQNGNTTNLPTTPTGGSQTTDGSDFYIMVLEKDASALVFGTYFGDSQSFGEHVDGGTSRFDKRGVIYQSVCAGCGGFSSFPTTPGVVSNLNGSTNCNNALFVYDFSKLQARYSSTASGGCAPLSLKFKSVSVYDQQIRWDFDDGSTFLGNSQDSVAHTFQNPGIYKVKLVAYNPEGCPSKDSTLQTITVQKPVPFSGDTLRFCNPGDTIAMPLLPQGDLTYSWEPAIFMENPSTNPVRLIQPDSSLWYTATVKTSEGCASQARFLLRNGVLLARGLADTLRGCAPLSLTFSTKSRFAASEKWMFGDGDSSAVLPANSLISHSYSQAGLYKAILRSENDSSCALLDTDTLQIRVSAGPALPDTMLRYCLDDNLPLQAPAGTALSWSWSPGQFLSDSLLSNPVLQQAAPGVFELLAGDSLGCFSRSRVEVRDGRLKAVFGIPDVPLCAPTILQPVNLSVNPVLSRFYWGQDSVTAQGLDSVSLNFSKGGTYRIRLKVWSDTACLASADTSLEISLGGPGFTGPELLNFCPGDSVLLQAPLQAGYQYSWPPEAVVYFNPSQAILYPADSMQIKVRITDSLQCEGESRFLLQPIRPDTLIRILSEFEPCTDRLQYRISAGNEAGNQYRWSINGDTILRQPAFSFVFPERGDYRIQLRSEKQSCFDSSEKILSVNDPPLELKADFEFRLAYEDCAEAPRVQIENKSLGADRQIWTWNGQFSFDEIPVLQVDGRDSIRLSLLVYKGLCLNEMTRMIPLGALRPPNLITLQEDGLNDEFRILNLPEGSSLEIRDRWGKLLLQGENYQSNWKPEKEGVYFYQLRFPDGGSCRSWIQAVR